MKLSRNYHDGYSSGYKWVQLWVHAALPVFTSVFAYWVQSGYTVGTTMGTQRVQVGTT